MILLFARGLQWLPSSGFVDPTEDLAGAVRHALLPAFALGLGLMAHLTRMTRATMTGILKQEFIRVARAKGLAERTVIWRYGLGNAIGPVMTVAGLQVGYLFGSIIVIDYKTGRRVARDGWFDTRLSEPQLPLYCLDLDDAVGAAMLARVRRDDGGCAFVGVGHGDDVAPGVAPPGAEDAAPSWEALLAHWRTALGLLATEVAAGRADPTPSAQACEYCPYGALCRVRERQDEAGGD